MVAGEDAETAGVNGQGFVDAELGGEIGDRVGAQDAGVHGAPGAVGVQIFLLAAVDVVDAAVQAELGGAALQVFQRDFVEQGDGVLIELPPAGGVEVAEEADGSRSPNTSRGCGRRPRDVRCAGAMKRSRVRASLTTGATWLAASVSMRISFSRKTRGSLVCTTRTP